ncbi:putative class A rhodopsin-like G-protein coupled receptor GPRpgn [Operophtera brumata]|uniref:mRNA export factor GLE1 n=1 Tax=Operophtera brumata TaxID=104452 RepID=A0A0L7K8E1_OPEBR|nr:putative class A rhodopsin-like G-protein coupled receptor GPRpgn [Operophtera brumata]
MDSSRDDSTIEDIFLYNNSSYTRKGDVSISEHLADFERMRISALTKAAVMSPHVKYVTIGPNSPLKKELPEAVEPPKKETIKEATLIEDKVRQDLRYTLIMKEYEAKLQEASETIFKGLIGRMVENHTEVQERCRRKLAEECRSKILEMRKLQLLREMQANDNCFILEKAREDQQKNEMLNRQRLESMNRVLEEQNRATARFAAITDSHTKICICYNEITTTLNTDPYSKHIFNKYVPLINSVVTNICAIMDLCSSDQTSDKEVKQAEVLSVNLANIKTKIIQDINALKQEEINTRNKEEALKQQELERNKAEEQKAAELARKAAAEQPKKAVPMFFSSKNYNYYEELGIFLEQYEGQYKELLENANLKKFRFDCQKAVNTPVNALSSVSGMHIRDKYDKLSKLLKGEKVQVLDIYVTATQHPHGLAYCTALLAKKIVRQGDLLVSSNPEAAFPLAALTVALWAQFPDFGKLIEAYFHKLCPYLVPMFLPQREGQTDKEFYLSRGYTYSEEGAVEKQDKFLKRMSGIFRLRCAIWIATTPKFINAPNPHGLQHGWRWLASFINLRPEPDICATLLNDFFSVCGSQFNKHYGKQFLKVLKLVNSQYMVVLQNIDEGGPKTRLEVFLQNILSTGLIPPPTGLLNPNTW